MPADVVPGGNSLPGSQMVALSLPSHRERETETEEDSNPIGSGPNILTSFNLNHFLRGINSKYSRSEA